MRPSLTILPVCLALTMALAACGGGGANNPVVPPVTPVTPVPFSILTQPAAISVVAGQPATFSVSASGSALTYQWQRNGADVAGATASSTQLSAAQLADDGSRWSVVIKNSGATLQSAEALLTVTPPRGLGLVAGMVGGRGNADGPIGRLDQPATLSVGPSGVLYFAQPPGLVSVVRSVTLGSGDAAVATVAKGSGAYVDLQADPSGNLVGIIGNRIVRIGTDGIERPLAGADTPGYVDGAGAQARFSEPHALAIDSSGLVYVADFNGKVRTINAAGVVATHAAATAALFDQTGTLNGVPIGVFNYPYTIAVDGSGNIYLGSSGTNLRKVTPAGIKSLIAMPSASALAADRVGNVYSMDRCTVYKADPLGNVTVLAGAPGSFGTQDGPGATARFGDIYGCAGHLATDAAGVVYVADQGNSTLRKIDAAGVVSTIAGKVEAPGLVDGSGTQARFSASAGQLSYDGQGNFYLVQDGRVRKVTRAGVTTTLDLPQALNYFTGTLAFQGSLLGVGNNVLYTVDAGGKASFVAGSPNHQAWTDGIGAAAGFGTITGTARDGAGNLYVLDTIYNTGALATPPAWIETHVRKITPAGVVSTLYAPPHDTAQRQPTGIAADQAGNVYLATYNSVVLKIAPGAAPVSIPVDIVYNAVAVDQAGNLYVSGAGDIETLVEKVSSTGTAQVIGGRANSQGVILGALPGSLNRINGMACDERSVCHVLSENALLRLVP